MHEDRKRLSRLPEGGEEFIFSSAKRPGRLWCLTSHLNNGCAGPFLGVERHEREANYSRLLIPNKNAWSYTFIPPVYLHGVSLSDAA